MTRCLPPRRAWMIALPFMLVACATQSPPSSAQTPPPATASKAAAVTQAPAATPLPAMPAPAPASSIPPPPPPLPKPPTAAVRAAFVSDTATKYGVDPAHIESVLARAQIRDGIIAAMSRPAETKPWRDYRPIFVTQQRISGGQAFLATHRDALARVEAQYGVPAEIIVAILGVETNWGANTGNYPVVDALYTLAFNYPRTDAPDKVARENQREAFFREELGQLFALGKDTGLDITTLTGSYAGAMGWGQFMPSSYRLYAVDGDGDGKRDLFNDLDDVFASVANYFVQKGGWVRGTPVMAPASYTPGTLALVDSAGEPIHTLAVLGQAGYQPRYPLPADITAAPIVLDGDGGDEHWLTFRNFRAIWSYNNSIRYATAVYQLAEAIAGRDPVPAPAPVSIPPVGAPSGQPGQ